MMNVEMERREESRPDSNIALGGGLLSFFSRILRLNASDLMALLVIIGFNVWAWLKIAGLY